VDRVHYFAHWITRWAPPAVMTPGSSSPAPRPSRRPLTTPAETIAWEWIRPGTALRRHRDGEIELIFPTICNLKAIGRFATSEELLAAAAAAGRIPVIEPRVVADGNGVRILLPGDPGYDGAVAAKAPEHPGDFNEAVRAISLAANPEPEPG